MRHKSKKILNSAKGKECQVRIPGICNFDSQTTVAAHINGGGMGTKNSDIFIAYACSSCHAATDGHINSGYTKEELDYMHYEGMLRTQQILLDEGLIKI